MHRFFVSPAHIRAGQIRLDADILSHIRVLRLKPNEPFIICNGAGQDYICHLDGRTAQIQSSTKNTAEPKVHCAVYLAYAKGERLEYALQKCVELGAHSFTLFPAARSVVKYDATALSKKRLRWEKIVMEAAKQAGRGRIPVIHFADSFAAAISDAKTADMPLLFYEHEQKTSLKAALDTCPDFQSASLIIGPEGGFADYEITAAQEMGFAPVSLGARILRCETAPVAALAAVLFSAGEF